MRQAVVDALTQNLDKIPLNWHRYIFTDNIAAQRKRQLGFTFPPFSKVDNFREAGSSIGQLTFMNDQSSLGAAVLECIEDLIERHDDVSELPEKKSQGQERARHFTGHSDYFVAQKFTRSRFCVGRWALDVERWMFPNHNRSIPVSHARAARQ